MSENIPTPAEVAAATTDTTETPPENTPPPEPTDTPEMTLDDYKQALEKTRKEAASYRVKLKEITPLAEQRQQELDAEKTELQKATEQLAETQHKLAELEKNNLKLALINEYGLDPEDAGLLGDGDKEKMTANAERLKTLAARAASAATTQQPTEHLTPGASQGGQEPPASQFPSTWLPQS